MCEIVLNGSHRISLEWNVQKVFLKMSDSSLLTSEFMSLTKGEKQDRCQNMYSFVLFS